MSPTGPQPTTAMESPGRRPLRLKARRQHASDSHSAARSYVRPSGILSTPCRVEPPATEMYSAKPPGLMWFGRKS